MDFSEIKIKSNIEELFLEAKTKQTYVRVCAPMVRYSKVQFRTLVKNYGVNLCFTPMIMADSFCQNAKARASEFSTTVSDSPLVVQFAANNVDDFVDASKLIYPYADGVDLNCGCPQRWAMKDGYGSAMLSKPEVIYELVKGIRNSLPSSFSVSVKIRILKEIKNTIEMCRQMEKCSVTFLTVHGRTPAQKSTGKVDTVALKEVCKSLQIPVIANGGIKSLSDSDEMFNAANCRGVMAASSILTNPALFSGANKTPLSCVKLWMDLKDKNSNKITFQCYHHHLVFMLEKALTREQKEVFNRLSTFGSVDKFVNENIFNYDAVHAEIMHNLDDFITCEFPDEITLKHSSKCRSCSKSKFYCICSKYNSDATDGNYFMSHVKESDTLDYMDSNIFDDPF